MEIFIIIIGFIIVIILLINKQSAIWKLIYKLDKLTKKIDGLVEKPLDVIVKSAELEKKSTTETKPDILQETKEPTPVVEKTEEQKIHEKEEVIISHSKPSYQPVRVPVNIPPVTKPLPTFFERYPDLEKFIGENLINKIGIGILVLGIGFFVKYAIDKHWINEIGRVFIGIISGGVLLAIAHKLRKSFIAFSSVLVGGGIAVLYFTIAITFHEYHLLSQTAAFIIMVIITAFAILLSISYNRVELAVVAILGGFATPFIVSTGEGNYIVLFTYILLLNVGMLVLAYFKKWNILNIVSYVFTIILYGSWLFMKVADVENAPYTGAFVFGTLFYFVFFVMNIINNVKEKRKFNALEISILISNTFLYYSAGMFILSHIANGELKGLFTCLIAVFNFIFTYSLYKNKKVDKNLLFLLIGLVLTFLSLAAPVQLEGNYITLFWSFETILLLWLSQKSGIKIIKIGSVIVMILMFISLVMDWRQIYIIYDAASTLNIIFNKGFIASSVAVASIFGVIFLLKKDASHDIFPGFNIISYKNILSFAVTIFLYVSILLELNYQLVQYVDFSPARNVIIGFYNFIFITGLLLYAIKKDITNLVTGTFMLGIIGVLAYLVFYHNEVIKIRNDYLLNDAIWSFLFHYLDVIMIMIILLLCLKSVQKQFKLNSIPGKTFLWFAVFAVVFIVSAELDHIVLLIGHQPEISMAHILKQNHKIGFPILWGVCSFTLMIVGMKLKMRDLRIISLSLFLITLLKLFIFDIRNISEGGKIAAFISLGIILLIVSFMYQKLKYLILEPEKPATNTPRHKDAQR